MGGQDVATLARSARASAGFGPAAPATNGDAGAPVRAAANVLGDADDVVVIWGSRVASGERASEAVDALLALAGALDLGGREESGLIEVPTGTNGRGLREVGCRPGLGPGLKDVEVGGADEAGALLLVEEDAPASRLEGAGAVIAFATFRSEALDEHADVVFPAEIYPEKEGTITHPDGRLQRVRQALGGAGEVRPTWQVLAELCERMGAGTGALTAPMVTAALADAVPFDAGITLDEIGGLGVRWQERDAAASLPAEELPDTPLPTPTAAPEGLVAVSVSTLWSGPETEHSPSLRFLATEPRAEISVEDARRAGIENGDPVVLSANGHELEALAAVRSAVPAGSVFVVDGGLTEGPVEIGPARETATVGA